MPRRCPGSVSVEPLDDDGAERLAPVGCDPGLGPPQRLGQTPVNHQGLAVLFHDDVGRLGITMQDTAAMGIIDCIAHGEELPQGLEQR